MHYFFLILFQLSCLSAFSQIINVPQVSAKRALKNSNLALEIGDIYTGIAFLEQYNQKKPNDIENGIRFGELLLKNRFYDQALDVLEVYAAESKDAALLYAQSLIHLEEYKEANEVVKLISPIKNRNCSSCKLFNDQLSRIKNSLALYDSLQKLDSIQLVSINALPSTINNGYSEFGINWYDEGLYYSTIESDTVIVNSKSETLIGLPGANTYRAISLGSDWIKEDLIQIDSTQNAIVGNIQFLDSEQQLFYIREERIDDQLSSKLYVKEQIDEFEYSNPYLSNLNRYMNYSNIYMIFITKNIKNGEPLMYFVSDYERKSLGGKDIFVATYDRVKKDFRQPKNLGSNINTVHDEISPFYDTTNSYLYYSSDGLASLGGFDIYKAAGTNKKFGVSENIGTGINSSVDDVNFILRSESKGFLASNRRGTQSEIIEENPNCCDDIFEFTLQEKIKINLSIEIANSDSLSVPNDQYANATLYYLDRKENPIPIKFDSFLIKGGTFEAVVEANQNYLFYANSFGYFGTETKFNTNQANDELKLNQTITFNPIPKTAIVIPNIYYEFDQSVLTESSKAAIDTSILRILEFNPNILIEIISHTDNKGAESYNLSLSEERAASVVEYLISKGIDKKRLTSSGKGESNPIAPNTNSDGSDNPEGRAKNRRTEFIVIGELVNGAEIIYNDSPK